MANELMTCRRVQRSFSTLVPRASPQSNTFQLLKDGLPRRLKRHSGAGEKLRPPADARQPRRRPARPWRTRLSKPGRRPIRVGRPSLRPLTRARTPLHSEWMGLRSGSPFPRREDRVFLLDVADEEPSSLRMTLRWLRYRGFRDRSPRSRAASSQAALASATSARFAC